MTNGEPCHRAMLGPWLLTQAPVPWPVLNVP